MSKEQLEHTSIILETFAFFLVTIDLYGKERLVELRDRIRTVKVTQVKRTNLFQKMTLILSIALVCGLSIYLRKQFIDSLHFFGAGANSIFNVIIGACLTSLLLVISNYGKVHNFLRDKIFANIVRGILFLLSIFPLQGIMLAIGAVIFVIAKTIAYLVV